MKAYIFLLAILALSAFLVLRSLDDAHAAVACPMIVKLCADGSSVSAKGPNCEMPACPTAKPDTTDEPPDADDCDDNDCGNKKTDEQND